MKTKMITLVSCAALVAGLSISPAVLASNSTEVAKALAGTAVLELPAKAASLVAKASPEDKQNVAAAAVKAAIGLSPSAAVAVVSAVARETPAVAPVAAVTAATLQHKRIDLFTKATVAAAPTEASKIVAALIKEFPQDYGVVAVAAAQSAPSAGREILAAVAEYVPALQASIQNAIAGFGANDGNLPIQAILLQSYDQAVTSGAVASAKVSTALAPTTSATSGGPSLSPTVINAPFTPPTGPITTIDPSQTAPQAPGGRNYSSP
jgi:hypothetical protein